MNWRYVPYAGFFVFSLLLTIIGYVIMPQASPMELIFSLLSRFCALFCFWFVIRAIARWLDKRMPYKSGFSRRVLIQIVLSIIVLVPPVLIIAYFIAPGLPQYHTKQYQALAWILLTLIIVLMNTGLAAGVFFSSWQKSVKEKARAEEDKMQVEMQLMQAKQMQAEMEMKALRAQMNPHFIFNSLNSINKYILKSDHTNASRYLTRFAKLIRLILDNSNHKEVALSDELEALKLYIEMESLRFSNKFDFEIIVHENVQADSLQVPPLIIQPYVENAIWHGLLHKEMDGRLTVDVATIAGNLLQCTIEDNGIGRARAIELKSKSATANKSLGMKLTQERITMLNQYSDLHASIQITDLVNELGEASGTRVILTIPI